MKIRKVLIIRFSAMGDIILTTPIVRVLKKQLNVEVHYLTKLHFAEILALNPHIDHIWTIPDHSNLLVKALKAEKFDLVIDLHKNLRSMFFRVCLRRKTLSIDKRTLYKWLYLLFGYDNLKRQHVVDLYFKDLQSLEVANDGMGLEFSIDPEDHVEVNPHLKNRIAVVMGASQVTKRIPVHIIDFLATIPDCEVYLLGGQDVKHAPAPRGNHIIDFRATLTIRQSASILKQCDVVITGDTGLMHIAAALKKPLMVIWGSTSELFGMYPYFPTVHTAGYISLEASELPCHPCSKYGRSSCPKKHMNCLKSISTLTVGRALSDLLPKDKSKISTH